jgi:drug/metabolite transporter (DMT)-like permease
MTESALRLLVVVRVLCFVAVVYLGLHIIFSRLISRPESKVLWFFSVLTLPLLWPVRTWIAPNANEPRLRFTALLVYSLLWALALFLTSMLAPTPR